MHSKVEMHFSASFFDRVPESYMGIVTVHSGKEFMENLERTHNTQ